MEDNVKVKDFNEIVIIGAGLAAEWIYRDIEDKSSVGMDRMPRTN